MSKTLKVTVNVTVADDVDPENCDEAIFDHLCADESDELEFIESVDGFDVTDG